MRDEVELGTRFEVEVAREGDLDLPPFAAPILGQLDGVCTLFELLTQTVGHGIAPDRVIPPVRELSHDLGQSERPLILVRELVLPTEEVCDVPHHLEDVLGAQVLAGIEVDEESAGHLAVVVDDLLVREDPDPFLPRDARANVAKDAHLMLKAVN